MSTLLFLLAMTFFYAIIMLAVPDAPQQCIANCELKDVILMRVKTRLLKLLENNHGVYVSGSELASELSVSRNAVWKAVESLRTDGYEISAITNKGYRLLDRGDIISEVSIAAHIKNEGVFHFDIRKSVTSSNTLLRELAVKGAPEGTVIVAEEQTAGKGRMGRAFHSPAGHGVYFSLLLRPGPKTNEAALITAAAAVATARAIEEVFGVRVGIKWVNDLYLDEKKVCGILTNATFDMENSLMESAVLGIGVNVTTPEHGYPEGIEAVAAAITDRLIGKNGERCRLIAATLDSFWGFYNELSARRFLDEYRARSILLGRDIYVLSQEGKQPARALEIDDECRLVVRFDNGEVAAIGSGEVSIRART